MSLSLSSKAEMSVFVEMLSSYYILELLEGERDKKSTLAPIMTGFNLPLYSYKVFEL